MKEQNLKFPKIDKEWTLFLDRDGVINEKIENGYVLNIQMFKFLDNVLPAFPILSQIFGKIIVVTNQRGIGKNLMSIEDLESIHRFMLREIQKAHGRIDAIFYCPHDYEKEECNCRKPKIAMALKAKAMFPDIDLKKSIVVGDSKSDMEFAKNIGAIGVCIGENISGDFDIFYFRDLKAFAGALIEVL